jgi:hypothetical protein
VAGRSRLPVMPVCSRSARSLDRVLIPGDSLVIVKINSLTGGELVHFTMQIRRFRNLCTRTDAKV